MGRLRNFTGKMGHHILQLLFPLRCPVCDEIVRPYGEKICAECVKKLRLVTPPYCLRCGKKVGNGEEFCTDCRSASHVFERGRALYEYDSAAASIYRLKYHGRQEYADYFGEEIARRLRRFIKETRPDALIPVPLHKKRLKARGYNQAALLARAVGRRTGIPVQEKMLTRMKNTAPLKRLNPKERQNNLKKAFNIKENDVKLKSVILIDDIYTTGSTMDEAARALTAGGVEHVYFIALACGAGI